MPGLQTPSRGPVDLTPQEPELTWTGASEAGPTAGPVNPEPSYDGGARCLALEIF